MSHRRRGRIAPARPAHGGALLFAETKKQSPNTGARANNTLHK